MHQRCSLARAISVIIPTFSRQRQTDEAIESITAAWPASIEIVVVDDHSDVPYEYLAERNSHGISVRIIRRTTNGGPGLARRSGVESATGEVIAFLDSDDVYGKTWVDALVNEHESQDASLRESIVYVGKVESGKASSRIVWKILWSLPDALKLTVCRAIVVMFNPFYTPSLALSKGLCRFSEDLRYCEDYFTFMSAIFRAKKLTLVPEVACVLGRHPDSTGGISDRRTDMFDGEMSVRSEMLSATYVPVVYKLFVPLGMAYQYIRTWMKKCCA